MNHTFEIKKTAKTRSLTEHLRTLTYVKHIGAHDRILPSEKEMIVRVRKSEKSKSITLEEAIKISGQWHS